MVDALVAAAAALLDACTVSDNPCRFNFNSDEKRYVRESGEMRGYRIPHIQMRPFRVLHSIDGSGSV